MIALFLLGLIAAAELNFAGIPLARLPSLGLGEPVFVEGADQWKAGVSDGFMIEIIETDVRAAQSRFSFQSATIGAKLPDLTLANADEAAGDAGLVIARRGNVVLLVRSSDAVATATRLLAAVEAAAAVGALPGVGAASGVETAAIHGVEAGPFSPAVEARDSFGRRIR